MKKMMHEAGGLLSTTPRLTTACTRPRISMNVIVGLSVPQLNARRVMPGVGLLRVAYIYMNTKIKRPPTIWLTQTLLAIFALLWLFIALFNLTMLLRNGIGEGVSIVRAVIGYSVIFGFVLLLLIAFWGLAKRKMYGKWLGLLSLILLWALITFIQLRRPAGPYKYYEYDNPAQVAGAAIFQVFLHGLFLTLILRLSFAKRVGEFFRKEIESS